MTEFLQGGSESIEEAKKAAAYAINNVEVKGRKLVYSINDVKIEAPVPAPGKMICVGHNYREHILEMKRELPPHPVVFAKFSIPTITHIAWTKSYPQ